MFALGGRAFTKSLADRLDLPFPRAESLKVDYARGLAVEQRDEVAGIVADDVEVWAAGVELVMEELARRRPAAGPDLPLRRRLAAAGDPRGARRRRGSGSGCPFARPPEVIVMAPDQVESITDATELLVDQQDVTPMGLAFQAIELQTTEDPLDAALRRVLRAMKV